MKPYKIERAGWKGYTITNLETGLGVAFENVTRSQAEEKYLQRHPEFVNIRHSHHPRIFIPKGDEK